MVINHTGRKRGNFKKKYISRTMKNQSKIMIPGVFWSTIYQITIENTAAKKVPVTRPKNPNIDWPEVIDMPMAMMIIAHTNRCSTKNASVSFKKATIPTVKVAHATRNPKADSSEPKNLGITRIAFPICCHALWGGRCSGSFDLLKPDPTRWRSQ